MKYRYEVTSIQGLLQLLTNHLTNGYWFHVSGVVPEGRVPEELDSKLIEKYDVAISSWRRSKRKRDGLYNIHYLRFERRWFLMATHGKGREGAPDFHQLERRNIKDARRSPIRVNGYAVSYQEGPDGKHHVHIRIDKPDYKALKAHFLELATRRQAEALVDAFWRVPFEPYAPVRRQLFNVWRGVNKARKAAGYQRLPVECIPMKRKIVRPFEERRG